MRVGCNGGVDVGTIVFARGADGVRVGLANWMRLEAG